MIHRETASPLLNGSRELWDLQPDLLMSQAYQQEIVDVDDFFMLQDEHDLTPRIIRQTGQDLVGATVHVGGDRFGPRAIALEEGL